MRRAIPVLFALSLVPLLPASQEPVPSFQLVLGPTPPTCTDPQQNYSCNPTVSIQNWVANADYSVCGQLECHLELKPPSSPGGQWTTVILHEFGNDQSPINSLILRPDGTFYGVTADIYTNSGIGTVYSLKPE